MKAVVVGEAGAELRVVATPNFGPEEVLIRVRAAALNRTDVLMAAGHKHGETGGPGTILGAECAGDVIAVGHAVTGIKTGDRVMCSCKAAFAEYAVADMGRVHQIVSDRVTYASAATLPVALQTMHNAVVTAGRLKPGETILVQGASSGVGLAALQIAKLSRAALVIGTSTNAGKLAKLANFGADIAISTRDPQWVDRVLNATGGAGVDLIIDQISGGVANGNLRATKVLGRIVNVGRLGGFTGDFNFDLHAERRIDYIGVTFRTRGLDEIREVNSLMRKDLWSFVEAGKITIPIYSQFRIDDAVSALDIMAKNLHFGKIIINI
ncbi:NADPH2:quinone reductase [Tardiphaga sp. OK246]|uniref:quinone oxidoreductase family protein n=1 Tax=Tardiphaga sp. OK246 TaxID=1855307 RepID=UPI000B69BB20|nr:zinc-binding dehydrogenase [Tardiphaga sp. OK246]SNT32585.1 NADPH2:quinone reductase [Tardiphaga sp. OK246]